MAHQLLQQMLHQGSVATDPADGRHRSGRGWLRQVIRKEGEPPLESRIEEAEAVEGHQQGLHPFPEAEIFKQPAAGLGEGIGPPPGRELVGPEGILQGHGPARIGQGQGRQAAGRTRADHPGLEWGGHQGGRQQKAAAESAAA